MSQIKSNVVMTGRILCLTPKTLTQSQMGEYVQIFSNAHRTYALVYKKIHSTQETQIDVVNSIPEMFSGPNASEM
jgi:hypothetical protein